MDAAEVENDLVEVLFTEKQIVAVVGAFHAPVMNGEHPAMTDDEFASLRRRASKFTLMPYSYFKLSTQSGYGAGNQAPTVTAGADQSAGRGRRRGAFAPH